MLPLTLASKSCCHHKVIYSSPAGTKPTALLFLGKRKHTELHPDSVHMLYVCECADIPTFACTMNAHTHTHSHRRAPVFCHFLTLCCSEVLLGAARQTNHFTKLGFDLCFQELWFCWAKQLAAPNSTSVPPWKGRVIIFCWGWEWGRDRCFHSSSHLCKRKLEANKEEFSLLPFLRAILPLKYKIHELYNNFRTLRWGFRWRLASWKSMFEYLNTDSTKTTEWVKPERVRRLFFSTRLTPSISLPNSHRHVPN